MLLRAGMDAPQFELPDANMGMFSLEAPRGKKYGVHTHGHAGEIFNLIKELK